MSDFIEKADYNSTIEDGLLDEITEMNDSVLDKEELKAISLAKGYINVRHDSDAIFAKSGANRNHAMVMIILDITLYFIHKRLSPLDIPTHRKEAYKEAIEWLRELRDGEIDPPGLELKDSETSTPVINWGSNPKRTNHI